MPCTTAGARELGTVLKEEFHLSFPFLFEFEGALLMCSESREAREIRIYECVEFPLKWRLKTVAMRNVVAADTDRERPPVSSKRGTVDR